MWPSVNGFIVQNFAQKKNCLTSPMADITVPIVNPSQILAIPDVSNCLLMPEYYTNYTYKILDVKMSILCIFYYLIEEIFPY